MLNSPILDVAIGLVLLFLMLSTICSGVYELFASLLAKRAKDLEVAIRNMIADPALADAFFEHPIITRLGTRALLGERGPGEARVSHVPPELFSRVLLSVLPSAGGAPPAVVALRTSVQDAPGLSADAKRSLLFHLDQAGGEMSKAAESIEHWFDHGMDELSQLYRRRAQFWLTVIATGITIAFNVDVGLVATTLWRDPTLRAGIVEQAAEVAKQGPGTLPAANGTLESVENMQVAVGKLELPIFWPSAHDAANDERNWPTGRLDMMRRIGGYLVAIAAISLGAPFWFDALRKLLDMRPAAKKEEKKA